MDRKASWHRRSVLGLSVLHQTTATKMSDYFLMSLSRPGSRCMGLPGFHCTTRGGAPARPAPQTCSLPVPRYIQDEPKLGRGRRRGVRGCVLPGVGRHSGALTCCRTRPELPVVDGGDTVLEIAAIMARTRPRWSRWSRTADARRAAHLFRDGDGLTQGRREPRDRTEPGRDTARGECATIATVRPARKSRRG